MIDVIAQSGRYSPIAQALKDFVVEEEKRYWVHVAIDRFTGQIIDRQIEVVKQYPLRELSVIRHGESVRWWIGYRSGQELRAGSERAGSRFPP